MVHEGNNIHPHDLFLAAAIAVHYPGLKLGPNTGILQYARVLYLGCIFLVFFFSAKHSCAMNHEYFAEKCVLGCCTQFADIGFICYKTLRILCKAYLYSRSNRFDRRCRVQRTSQIVKDHTMTIIILASGWSSARKKKMWLPCTKWA